MSAKSRVPDRVLVHGLGGEMFHYIRPSSGGLLCGWEGGIPGRILDEPGPIDCPDCRAIVVDLWRMWHPRSPPPAELEASPPADKIDRVTGVRRG